MSEQIKELPAYELKTLDGRFIQIRQSVDRYQHPIIVIETFSVNMQLQSTVKIGFKDIGNIRLALQTFADAMLDAMCDY